MLASFFLPTRAAAPIPLRAGPLTMVFEPDNAFLRYVKAGPYEVLRGITAPVRNQLWGTVPPAVTNLKLDDQKDHFTLTFDVLCQERDIDFLWHGSIKGSAQGEVEYIFDGTARSTFMRNRIGFCVLHGETAAGKPWIIENVRGEKLKGNFPSYISPHQPAKDIRAISHELASGVWAEVRFEGEVFEMEDQRNWTDASFKTYCTPLAIPYPVRLEQGTKVWQKITFRVQGAPPATSDESDKKVILSLGAETSPRLRVGLHVSTQTDELSDLDIKRLKLLNLDHLRVELTPSSNDFPRQLRQAAQQSKALGVGLLAALHFRDQPEVELKSLTAELEAVRPNISTWLVLGTNRANYHLARKKLKAFNSQSVVGFGDEEINFVQLNRFRPDSDMMEAVSYGMTPQIHAIDNASIIETLAIQGDTVRSARQFVGNHPIIISPITLGTSLATAPPPPGELPANVDVRQLSSFFAGWTVGSLKYLSEAGVQSATYFETVGWKGIMDSSRSSARTPKFPAPAGGVYPVYHVLYEFGQFVNGKVQRVTSTEPWSVVGLALSRTGITRLLVANLTDRPQSVTIRGLGQNLEVRPIDTHQVLSTESEVNAFGRQSTKATALVDPLTLPPYGIVRVDQAPIGKRKE